MNYLRSYHCQNCKHFVNIRCRKGVESPSNPICPNCGCHIDGTAPEKGGEITEWLTR